MTLDEARAMALEQPDTVEGSHHGNPDFRVRGKMFATLQPAKGISALRVPSFVAGAKAEERPEAFRVVSKNESGAWLAVTLNGVETGEYRALIEIARATIGP